MLFRSANSWLTDIPADRLNSGNAGSVTIIAGKLAILRGRLISPDALSYAVTLKRSRCGGHANRSQSSLVEAGRGGLPQDPEATLPALYVAGRDLNPNPQAGTVTEVSSPLQAAARLIMHCD